MLSKPFVPTSEGTLLSTIHGRDRRHLRCIGKRDLLAAKKYGKREKSNAPHGKAHRWKFTFADVVYITEHDEITEVTSYVLPMEIPPIAVTREDEQAHTALTEKMNETPSLCTSHFVIVIDQSGSMRKCDVDNYKTRSDAVYATIALDYIGQQIDHREKSNCKYTDAVTLIEMKNETAEIVFQREPCTNILYNKVLRRQKTTTPQGHGMFFNGLDLAKQVMMPDKEDNGSCTLMLFFLSDGCPSDGHVRGGRYYNPSQHMFQITTEFGPQLTVFTLGFGKSVMNQFEPLKSMASRACDAGAHGYFHHVNTSGNDLSTIVGRVSDTMSATRQMCVVNNSGRNSVRTVRTICHEAPCDIDYDNLNDGTWTLYQEGFNRFRWKKNKQRMALVGDGSGVAISTHMLGEGAERMVFRLVEIGKDAQGKWVPCSSPMVAKESKYVEDLTTDEFHSIFCKTQRQAAKLARKFNDQVIKKCKQHHLQVPAVLTFLDCNVLQVPLHEEDGYRMFLVEKRLDPSKYTKWNSNNGFVAGSQQLIDVFIRADRFKETGPTIARQNLVPVVEEDSEEDESVEEEQFEPPTKISRTVKFSSQHEFPFNILLDHVPQAFSHYTYRYTQRSQLVCDLQGVCNVDVHPARFELTDPVIHSNDPYKTQVFGRTDHGHKGIRNFMKTHVCNDLCRLLGFDNFI